MTHYLVSAPAAEPITKALALSWARVDDTRFDTIIDTYLLVWARKQCEELTRRAMITQTWAMKLSEFCEGGIEIPVTPLQSVSSITYYDANNNQQTLSASAYQVETTGLVGRITLAFGHSWPQVYPRIDAITVTWVAGYGATAASVPEGLRIWMLAQIAWFLRHPEAMTEPVALAPVPLYDGMLDPYRLVQV